MPAAFATVPPMQGSVLLWVLSLLLAGAAGVYARRFGATTGDRAMLFIAGFTTSISAASVGVSVFGVYRPAPFIAAQALLCAGLWFVGRLRRDRGTPEFQAATERWSWVGVALLAAIVGTAALTAWGQVRVPVFNWDERMYNCSRPAYWLHYGSVFAYESHNDRQSTFFFGGELWFGWPLMFTRAEVFGRLGIWLAHPLGMAAVFRLARASGAARNWALGAALAYGSTPTVLHTAGLSQKQDLWTALFVVASAYWVVRAATGGAARAWCLGMAAYAAVFAVSVKLTAAAVAPGLAAAVLWAGDWGVRAVWRRGALAGAGVAAALVLSGVVWIMAANVRDYGSPLGNPALSKVGRPDFSLRQAYTHIVRTPMILFELPVVPWERARTWMTDAGNRLIERLGADKPLPLEELKVWPAQYHFNAPPLAEKYSLGGTLWLPCLAVGLVGVARELVRSFPAVRWSARSWVIVLMAPLFLGMVFLVRWMGGAAERYWICVYALSLVVTMLLLASWGTRRRWVGAAAMVLLALTAGAAALGTWRNQSHYAAWTGNTAQLDEPFTEMVAGLTPGSRVLLIGSQNVRDYPLFLPRQGYPNAVFSWGKTPADPARLDRLIEEHAITDVVFENDRGVSLQWDGSVKTRGLAERMSQRDDFVRMPVSVPDQRWYRRSGLEAARATDLPAFSGWAVSDGLGPLEGPYPPALPVAVRWGIGESTRLQFQSPDDRARSLVLECRRNNQVDQTLRVEVNGERAMETRFDIAGGFERLVVPLRVKPGANEVVLRYGGYETVGQRKLAVLFRKIQIVPAE